MCLLVIDHLQPMFQRTQEAVGFLHLLCRLQRYPLFPGQFIEHPACLAAAEIVVAPTGNQLLRLHEKFDFANAAAAELYVVPGNGNDSMAAGGVDLALHRMNVVDGCEVEVFAPYIGRQRLEEALARSHVACDRPRLDESRTLPVLPAAFVIAFGGRKRHRHRRAARIGAQA